MAEEEFIEEGESGEEYLRHEEEVVELPPNVQNLQIKMERLRGEIANLQAQFENVREELDTRIAAFNWYNDQVQQALEE